MGTAELRNQEPTDKQTAGTLTLADTIRRMKGVGDTPENGLQAGRYPPRAGALFHPLSGATQQNSSRFRVRWTYPPIARLAGLSGAPAGRLPAGGVWQLVGTSLWV